MELDHVFWFVASQAAAERAVKQLGLIETYRRHHAGQGTSNICCCFDNAFIEFLWISDAKEASSPAIARMGLVERAGYESIGTCPFGVAWRGPAAEPKPPLWSFTPSYLPPGLSIPVAVQSDNHRLPLVFQSPGDSPPANWPIERRGSLQHTHNYHKLLRPTLSVPPALATDPLLSWLSDHHILNIETHFAERYSLTIDIADKHENTIARVVLPIENQFDL